MEIVVAYETVSSQQMLATDREYATVDVAKQRELVVSCSQRPIEIASGEKMIKRPLRAFATWAVFAAIATTSLSAFAGVSSGKILEVVVVASSNKAWVRMASITGSPASSGTCTGITTTIFMFDPTTTAGKALLTQADAALLAGKNVTIAGTGTCLNAGGLIAEGLDFISVTP